MPQDADDLWSEGVTLSSYDRWKARRYDVTDAEQRHENEQDYCEEQGWNAIIREHVLHEISLCEVRPFYGRLRIRPGCGCWICSLAGFDRPLDYSEELGREDIRENRR